MTELVEPALASPQPPLALDLIPLADQAGLGLAVLREGRIRLANAALAQMIGRSAQSLVGASAEAFLAEDSRAAAHAMVEQRLAGEAGPGCEVRCLRADGSVFEVRASAARIEFEGRDAALLTLFDVSELRSALRRAKWKGQMLARTEALSRTGSMELEWPGLRVRMSQGLRELLGLEAAAAAGPQALDALDWIAPEERDYVVGIWREAVRGEPFEFQHRIVTADGRRLTVLHRGALIEEGGSVTHGVALLQDITAQREAEQRIQELASQHEVTGLPNRAALLDQMDAAMQAARWDEREVALLAIEVPQITSLKNSMGFGAGDALAMALAARLREACRAGESVGQIADAEFAVLIEGEDLADEATLRPRAQALLDAISASVRLGATDVFAQGLAGVAVFPRDAADPAALLEAAQAARLDLAGGGALSFFRPEVNQPAVRAMQIESALRNAEAANEFELHFQPQVDLGDGAIRGAEALLRWNSAELGLVSPAEFIPVAERSGLIGAIGDWVLRRACEHLAEWRRLDLPRVRLGINLSPTQLQRPDLAAHVQNVLVASGADAGSLSIELTESMVMADVERAAQVLGDLEALGCEIALDDFGTGFSSLSYLCRLPIDVVKVDRSFVHDVMAPIETVSVTRAIIDMAHGLKMKVLAEGVETEAQLSMLSSNGCDMIQGYWFSRAVPAAEFTAMLAAGKSVPERFRLNTQKTRTLLLVDDEEHIVSALRRLLRRDGYRIVTAHSGAEGLHRLAENEVDVIVSDQRMPGMTGVEFLNRAKALYPDTVRLVLSGYTELQSILDAINEGAIYKFLTKPWDDERLRGHIAEAFRQKDLADENRRLARQVATANADLERLNVRLEQMLDQQSEHAAMLAASASHMRELLEELPASVVAVDPDGLISFVNREAAERLPGAAAWIGHDAHDCWPSDFVVALQDETRPRVALDLEGRRFVAGKRRLPATASLHSLLLLFDCER